MQQRHPAITAQEMKLMRNQLSAVDLVHSFTYGNLSALERTVLGGLCLNPHLPIPELTLSDREWRLFCPPISTDENSHFRLPEDAGQLYFVFPESSFQPFSVLAELSFFSYVSHSVLSSFSRTILSCLLSSIISPLLLFLRFPTASFIGFMRN
jgi:hypothetical protein